MLMTVFYYLYLISTILILSAIIVYLVSILISWLKGAPYVPTRNRDIQEILSKITIQKNSYFLELGCGDGRVIRTAEKQYAMKGKGVDINPVLIFWAKLKTYFQNITTLEFTVEDVQKTDLSKADIIYIFLFPQLVERMKEKIQTETKNNVIIISHGFKIPFLEKSLSATHQGNKFTTYYYKIAQNT